MVDTTMDGLAWLRKQAEQADTDLLQEMVKVFAERLMAEEADAICGAGYGERSDERVKRRRKGAPRPLPDSWISPPSGPMRSGPVPCLCTDGRVRR